MTFLVQTHATPQDSFQPELKSLQFEQIKLSNIDQALCEALFAWQTRVYTTFHAKLRMWITNSTIR